MSVFFGSPARAGALKRRNLERLRKYEAEQSELRRSIAERDARARARLVSTEEAAEVAARRGFIESLLEKSAHDEARCSRLIRCLSKHVLALDDAAWNAVLCLAVEGVKSTGKPALR